MNQAQFAELCTATAQALSTELFLEEDDRCMLSIDGVDVLVDLDEDNDALLCYVDLGDPSPHDRVQVCEQLLGLNLSTHSIHAGAYAFEASSGRAIFCANLFGTETMTGDELAEALRDYVDETEEARQMVANPLLKGTAAPENVGSLFTGALA